MIHLIALLCLSLASFANAAAEKAAVDTPATLLHYRIISERNHPTELFTEGLLLDGGYFYESSGRYDNSLLVSYPSAEAPAGKTPAFSQKKSVAGKYFAEGLSLFKGKLYQLTWREGALLVYDLRSFKLSKTLKYKGEGWGLTQDGKHLIRSDGSATLFFHNPGSFAIERELVVRLGRSPLAKLNELEYSEGYIWANIWQDNRIVKIDPAGGQVVGVLDLSAIATSLQLNDPESVLNGIAYDPDNKALWVTGKHWPKMFLLKITD